MREPFDLRRGDYQHETRRYTSWIPSHRPVRPLLTSSLHVVKDTCWIMRAEGSNDAEPAGLSREVLQDDTSDKLVALRRGQESDVQPGLNQEEIACDGRERTRVTLHDDVNQSRRRSGPSDRLRRGGRPTRKLPTATTI